MPFDPSKPTSHILRMQSAAALANTLFQGTQAMRDAGQTYLPKFQAESDEAYTARKGSSFLLNMVKKTVNRVTGLPFGAPVELGDDVPAELKAWAEDIDLQGRDLTCFCRDVFRKTMLDGIGWVFIDYPRMTEPPTLADERAQGVRPFWVHVPLEHMIALKAIRQAGHWVLVDVRWMECREDEQGDEKSQVRRIQLTAAGVMATVYVQNEKKEWVEDTSQGGLMTPIKEIPLVTLYTGRTGYLCAEPPLDDLAWKNLEHWQSASDQRHILHTTRVPLLFGKNLVKQEGGALVIGPNRLIEGQGQDADLKWVSAGVEGVEAGHQDLLNLEEQMRQIAGELIVRMASDKTAKEAGLEADQNNASLRALVETFEDALEEALRITAAWRNLPAGGTVHISEEWADLGLDAPELLALLQAVQANKISDETWLANLKRAGFLPEDTDIETEIQRLQDQADRAMPKMPAVPTKPMPAMP